LKTSKGKGRRLLATVLSFADVSRVASCRAFAARPCITVTFAYLYQSDGSLIMYQDTFVGTHGTNGGAGHSAVRIHADGETNYEKSAPLKRLETIKSAK